MLLPSPPICAELRASVARLLDWLDRPEVHVGDGWEHLARPFGAETGSLRERPSSLVVFADPDELVARVDGHSGEVGFVTVGSITTRTWPRSETSQMDPTMRLWRTGWSPLNVDRIRVATDEGSIEFVVGNARRTPESAPAASRGAD